MVNFDCVISGGPRANIHGCFHNRDVHQNLGPRVHPSQKQLHEEPLEHYGLYRRHIRVSNEYTLYSKETLRKRIVFAFNKFKILDLSLFLIAQLVG